MLGIKEVFLNIKAHTFVELINLLSPKLLAKSYINNGFVKKIINREKKFPTGLSFGKFNVAIPHVDSKYVKQSGIIAVKLKKPILMTHMATTNRKIKVCFLFILLVKESKLQVNILTELMNNFNDQKVQKKLYNLKTKAEMFAIFKK